MESYVISNTVYAGLNTYCMLLTAYFILYTYIGYCDTVTRTGWPRDLKTLRGPCRLKIIMFREEMKYLVDNLSSCFEIVTRVLKNGAKLTVKELAKLKNKARFGLSMADFQIGRAHV